MKRPPSAGPALPPRGQAWSDRDRNFHVTPMKPEAMAAEEWDAVLESVLASLYALVRDLGGTISGEHGIGRKRVRYLESSAEPAQLAAFRAVKRVFDPNGVLNPGVILSPGKE